MTDSRCASGGKTVKDIYEPTKVFCDVLFDYNNLRYIFEYGFSWDTDITKLIFGRDIQKLRELANALPDTVYQNCANVLWAESTSGKNKKSNRRLMWKNHYRLFQNQWFLEMYGCYASYSNWYADKKLEICAERFDDYDNCRQDSCSYRRFCEARTWKNAFMELARTMPMKSVWAGGKVHEQVLRYYKDVLLEDGERIRLKENRWHYPENQGVFLTDNEYQRFREMLVFFAGFTPLSVLGWNFFRRLGDGRPDDIECGIRWPQILIRNLPLDFGLEQEYLYRSLKAISDCRFVEYEGGQYLPVKLIYRDRGMNGLPQHLYLDAYEIPDRKTKGARRLLPLYGGAYLDVGGKYMEEKPLGEDGAEAACGKMITCEVEFYYREDITQYLLDRRREFWSDCIISQHTQSEYYHMHSPYYEDCTEWKKDMVCYQVPETDLEGFLQFIQSFGDFARISSDLEDQPMLSRPSCGSQRKGRARGYHSLLDPYSSDTLISELRNGKEPPKRLPPREAELEWLAFVLREYYGFCQIFLDEECLKRIADQLQTEINGRGWFDRSRWDYRSRVRDMNSGFAAKYRRILEIMRQGGVLTYEWGDRIVRIYPYALEYDVARHLTRHITEPPLDIMCYNMDEKRNVLVRYDKIRVKSFVPGKDIHFSQMEKLYHVLAYTMRCAERGSQDIWEKAAELLSHLWKEDPRGGDNYNRCVRKRFGRTWDFKTEYEKLEQQLEQQGDNVDGEFLQRIFAYWHEHEAEASDELVWRYQTSLLICMTDTCRQFDAARISGKLRTALDQITDSEIWELIGGKARDGIINEIAFYNEKLKNSWIAFALKNAEKETIELVYRLFGNYICAGEMDAAGKLRFTVTYETFNYRKIHMALMVLGNRIENLKPEKTAGLIAARMNNQKNSARR